MLDGPCRPQHPPPLPTAPVRGPQLLGRPLDGAQMPGGQPASIPSGSVEQGCQGADDLGPAVALGADDPGPARPGVAGSAPGRAGRSLPAATPSGPSPAWASGAASHWAGSGRCRSMAASTDRGASPGRPRASSPARPPSSSPRTSSSHVRGAEASGAPEIPQQLHRAGRDPGIRLVGEPQCQAEPQQVSSRPTGPRCTGGCPRRLPATQA